MPLAVVAVNVSAGDQVRLGGRVVPTGIVKRARPDRIHVGRLGLTGDVIADLENHGGRDQAVYLYGVEDYAWWESELGRELPPGMFGENLTVAGLASADVRVGTALRIGPNLVLEVTAPRIPCSKLAARVGERDFVRRFHAALRPGCYCRVLAEGDVGAGDAIVCEPGPDGVATMGELMRAWTTPHLSAADLRHLLAGPVAERVRAAYADQLADAERVGP